MTKEKRKTICQLVHSLNFGGAEILARRLATDPVLSEEYRFVFFCLDVPNLDQAGSMAKAVCDSGFEIECLNRQPGFDWGCVNRLRNLFQQYNVDLVHAHQCTPFFYASAARGFGDAPTILLTEHGRFYPDVVSRRRRWANWFLLGKNDYITAVGQSVADALVKKEGFPRDRIRIVFNGVDLKPFELADAQRRILRKEVRAEWGVHDDDFIAIQVARLDPIKDHTTALKTMAQLRRRVPKARLIVVGDGPQRQAIEKTRTELGLGDCVVLTGAREDINRQLAGADSFLLTSLSEGIPVTFLEAMASSLPIVCTNAGGCREVVIDEQTGLVAPVGDFEMLADSLIQLAEDESLRRRMGTNGRLRVATVFDQNTMHQTYRNLYQSIINEKNEK